MNRYQDNAPSAGAHGPDSARRQRIARRYADASERARIARDTDPDGAAMLRKDAARLRRILAAGV